MGADHERFDEVLSFALEESHLLHPSAVAELAEMAGEALGAHHYTIHVVDLSQHYLIPLLDADAERIDIDGSVAGRAYITGEVVEVSNDEGRQVWVPMVDGAERLGVVGFGISETDDNVIAHATRLSALITQFLVTKGQYTDDYRRAARIQDMSPWAEQQWDLLPPLTSTTRQYALSAVVEPVYDLGGDLFDYAVNGDIVHLAIIDAVGHGSTAVRPAAMAMAGIRHCRRHDFGLEDTYLTTSALLADEIGEQRFATACIARLDITSGRLCWLNAGHPAPLLVRNGKVIDELSCKPSPPLGIGHEPVEVQEIQLEPWDRVLFFTDGVIEGRVGRSEPFGVDRLANEVNKESMAGHGPAETMRRLAKAVLEHHAHELHDDFTMLMIEYRASEATADATAMKVSEQTSM